MFLAIYLTDYIKKIRVIIHNKYFIHDFYWSLSLILFRVFQKCHLQLSQCTLRTCTFTLHINANTKWIWRLIQVTMTLMSRERQDRQGTMFIFILFYFFSICSVYFTKALLHCVVLLFILANVLCKMPRQFAIFLFFNLRVFFFWHICITLPCYGSCQI